MGPTTKQWQNLALEALLQATNPRALHRYRAAHQRQLARLAMPIAVAHRGIHLRPTLTLRTPHKSRNLFLQKHLDELSDPLASH